MISMFSHISLITKRYKNRYRIGESINLLSKYPDIHTDRDMWTDMSHRGSLILKEYLITNSNADIVLPFGDQDLDGGQLGQVMTLHGRPHRVLEQLEHDVVKVGRRIGQGQGNLFPLLVHNFQLT